MQTKIIIFSFFLLCSCGKMTTVDDKKLESFSNITNAGTVKVDKTGVLKRGDGKTKDTISFEGSSYNVSMYSSYSALEFIAARKLGSEVNVNFKGEIRGVDIVLEFIEAN